jgi:ribosomal-protein-alanine N-acetyltransferase
MKIKLRKPLISDAKRYYEILNHPEFHYFPAKPATLKEEIEFLRGLKERVKKGVEHSFVIIANGKLIGGAGIRPDSKGPYRCEIGFFIDRKYWGKGIATKVVAMLEEYIAENLDITRVGIVLVTKNIGSRRVAIKSGYKKEGLMKKYQKLGDKFFDCHLYAKILK